MTTSGNVSRATCHFLSNGSVSLFFSSKIQKTTTRNIGQSQPAPDSVREIAARGRRARSDNGSARRRYATRRVGDDVAPHKHTRERNDQPTSQWQPLAVFLGRCGCFAWGCGRLAALASFDTFCPPGSIVDCRDAMRQ